MSMWSTGIADLGMTSMEADPPLTEDGEQCIHCLRFTYEPGYGCLACHRGLANDEFERHDDDDSD